MNNYCHILCHWRTCTNESLVICTEWITSDIHWMNNSWPLHSFEWFVTSYMWRTYGWITRHVDKSWRFTWISRYMWRTYEWIVTTRHDSFTNRHDPSRLIHESSRLVTTYSRDICDVQLNESLVTSYVTSAWVMSHVNESCHLCMSHVTYEWVISHMNELCHKWMRRDVYMWLNQSWRIHVTKSVVTHTCD
jgi:hypothetical protein